MRAASDTSHTSRTTESDDSSSLFVRADDLGLSDARAHGYSNSGGPDLARVVKSLEVRRSARAVDLGSGKGGAAFTLARFYEHVVGVEISPDLVAIARRNAARVRRKNVSFVRMDAGQFTALDEYSYIYMFNPFPAEVLQEVLANVQDSLDRAPRRLTVVYCEPVFHELVAASPVFTQVSKLEPRDHYGYGVYVHEANVGVNDR